jgi:ketosteroid isomerase-like protein
MKETSLKQSVRLHYQALGTGNVDLFTSLIDDSYSVSITGRSKSSATLSRDEVLAYVSSAQDLTRGGFDFEILTLIEEGDRVAAESIGRATLLNGSDYENHYVHLFDFVDGKIVKVKEFSDTAWAELNLLPPDA